MSINVAVLGATGSIGRQTLEVLSAMKEYGVRPVLLACAHNSAELIKKYGDRRDITVISDRGSGIAAAAKEYVGTDLLNRAETYAGIDVVINGIGGLSGVGPTIAALKAGCKLLTANKESVVAFGKHITALKAETGGIIIPLDSEHSAIFQCLLGEDTDSVSKLILTASGGALRDKKREEIAETKAADCLKHPNWSMGVKVTIDSATLMNKGLELIEARNLFGINEVDIKIHRQSVVHGAAAFKDGSLKIYASKPDMRIPIAYALSMPKRYKLPFSEEIGLEAVNGFTYTEPDTDRFPCLKLARVAADYDTDRAGAVLTAADEAAVNAYLRDEIDFYGVSELIEKALERFATGPEIADVYQLHSITDEVKEYILESIGGGN